MSQGWRKLFTLEPKASPGFRLVPGACRGSLPVTRALFLFSRPCCGAPHPHRARSQPNHLSKARYAPGSSACPLTCPPGLAGKVMPPVSPLLLPTLGLAEGSSGFAVPGLNPVERISPVLLFRGTQTGK